MDLVPEPELLKWCDEAPLERYPMSASVITFGKRENKDCPLRWTNTALALIEKAPDRAMVLKQFIASFMPTGGWSGSLADILESNAGLLDEFMHYPDMAIRKLVADEQIRLRETIQDRREWEARDHRGLDERF